MPNAAGIRRVIGLLGGPSATFDQLSPTPAERSRSSRAAGSSAVICRRGSPPTAPALFKSGFRVVQDILPSSLTESADVLLPSAAWAEKDGCWENYAGRIQAFQRPRCPRRRAPAARATFITSCWAGPGCTTPRRSARRWASRSRRSRLPVTGTRAGPAVRGTVRHLAARLAAVWCGTPGAEGVAREATWARGFDYCGGQPRRCCWAVRWSRPAPAAGFVPRLRPARSAPVPPVTPAAVLPATIPATLASTRPSRRRRRPGAGGHEKRLPPRLPFGLAAADDDEYTVMLVPRRGSSHGGEGWRTGRVEDHGGRAFAAPAPARDDYDQPGRKGIRGRPEGPVRRLPGRGEDGPGGAAGQVPPAGVVRPRESPDGSAGAAYTVVTLLEIHANRVYLFSAEARDEDYPAVRAAFDSVVGSMQWVK